MDAHYYNAAPFAERLIQMFPPANRHQGQQPLRSQGRDNQGVVVVTGPVPEGLPDKAGLRGTPENVAEVGANGTTRWAIQDPEEVTSHVRDSVGQRARNVGGNLARHPKGEVGGLLAQSRQLGAASGHMSRNMNHWSGYFRMSASSQFIAPWVMAWTSRSGSPLG